MSLIDRMITLNSRLTAIPVRLGVPQYRSLLIRHVTLDPTDLLADYTDTLIEPKPMIQNVPNSLVGLEVGSGGAFKAGGNITISKDDFQVTGIPRSYSLDFLTKDLAYYVIDPSVVQVDLPAPHLEVLYDAKGNPAGGLFCRLIHVSDRELLTWTLTLRKLNDHYDLDQSEVNY